MEFTVKSLKRNVLNRGLFTTDMQNIWEAIITLPNGDWIGVSQWEGEDYWVADCAFRANGFPIFSNGTGSRCTAVRTAAPEVADRLNDMAANLLEEEASGMISDMLAHEQDAYGREAEEESLGRPLFPNEY